MWSGSASEIPTGWQFCDGTNGTPDLRNRFVVGSGRTYSIGDTGGSGFVSVSTSQLPSHLHYTDGRGASARHAVRQGNDSFIDYRSVSSSINDAAYTSGSSTDSQGSGSLHENRPPFFAIAYIMKV